MRTVSAFGLALGLVAALLTPPSAAAQTVKGTVLTQGTGEPVAGALAVLLDSAGRRVTAGLAGPDGRFELQAPRPGRYRLAAERIGYATSYGPFFDLAAAATLERDIVASVQAVSLEAITVTAGSRCRRQRDAPADVQKLWDEARKALTSVSLVEDAPRVSFRSVVWDRDLDPELGVVRKERQRPVFAMGDYPFRSPPADDLLTHGFVRGPVADTVTYYAPDAHVLLSDAFLDDYCFRAVKGDSGLIGLAFEPVPGGPRVAGVTGTLWLDAVSAQLRRLDYGYVRLPIRPGKSEPGGELDLRRLGDGAVIVSSWAIRMPRFALVNGALTDSVAYVHETGGRVMEVQGLGRAQTLAMPTGTVRGHVFAEGGAPLRHVLVYLSGTSHADTTDADGAFAMPDVWTGRYELAWYDRKHDPTAQHVQPRSVDVHEGDNDVDITVPGMDNAMYGGCPADGRHPGLGVIVGVVREKGTGVPLGGVGVTITGLRGGEQQRFTDRAGRFRFCWQPTDMYRLEAALKGFGSVHTGVRLESLEVARRQLELQVAARPA
ncbi:MAG TPA: carboxypeptidase-like regulatory domain-containing protein, partial [Longimicrobiales bacterium]|nr:carboxypeptidase-like regulatory domain-containing protein [Longimicrobiales bacterium]